VTRKTYEEATIPKDISFEEAEATLVAVVMMTSEQALRRLEQLLADAPPEPEAVWEVFREWARHPVDCERDERSVWMGHAEGGAWIELRRSFEDPGSGCEEAVVLCLYSARPDAPHLGEAVERCEEARGLAEFFARVEGLPGFTLALGYPHWDFAAEVT
jgi:hypothetical protein